MATRRSTPSPLSFAAPGADVTYAARKELRARLTEADDSLGLRRYNTDPEWPHSAAHGAHRLQAAQGFRRQYLAATLRHGEDVYASFLDHLLGLSEAEPDAETLPLSSPSARCPSPAAMPSSSALGASPERAFLIALKGFVGASVLYLAAAWAAGGLTFSVLGMTLCCVWNYSTARLLLDANASLQVGYGELARRLVGPWLGGLVDTSLVLQQLAVCGMYYVFVAQSAVRAANVLTECRYAEWLGGQKGFAAFCTFQLLAYVPLSFVARLRQLAAPALVADVLLAVGLGYILYVEARQVLQFGPHPSVSWGVGPQPSVLLGIGLFAFEGIGLVLPIATSMAEPQRFPAVFAAVCGSLLALAVALGTLGYLAFGAEAKMDVLLNVAEASQHSPFTLMLLILYPLAVLAGYPIQFLPATHIVERALGLRRAPTQKRILRAGLTVLMLGVAMLGGRHFGHFVSICGALCSVPLAMVYPPMLHYVACAKDGPRRRLDLVAVAAGLATMLYVLGPSLWALAEDPPPALDVCMPPGPPT